MTRALRRQQMRQLHKQMASKINHTPPPPQRVGIGLTITNREFAIVFGSRVYGIDWAALRAKVKRAYRRVRSKARGGLRLA